MAPKSTQRFTRGSAQQIPALTPSVEHALDEASLDFDALDSEDASDAYRVSPETGELASTKKRHPRSHPYVPRTGKASQRNNDAQRRYRERIKERAAATETAVATATAEIAALRAEQVALREQSRSLDLLRHYSESLLTTLRSAAGSIATSFTSSLLSLQSDILDYLWNKALHPSDSQLRFIAHHIDRLPRSLSNVFVGRLLDAMEQWHRSPPAGREAVEKKLSGIFEARARLISIVLTEFPDTKEAHVMRARDGDAAVLHALIDNAASLSASDVLNAVVLTDDQIIALNSYWDTYRVRYYGAKGLVAAAAAQVHLASERFLSEENSMHGVMRRNADGQRGAEAAAGFLAQERAARADLLAAASRTLNPIQCAWLQLMAVRALPEPDIVGAITHILPHMTRAPVPTPTALLKLVGDRAAAVAASGGAGEGA
jgi:hypothetical protein